MNWEEDGKVAPNKARLIKTSSVCDWWEPITVLQIIMIELLLMFLQISITVKLYLMMYYHIAIPFKS